MSKITNLWGSRPSCFIGRASRFHGILLCPISLHLFSPTLNLQSANEDIWRPAGKRSLTLFRHFSECLQRTEYSIWCTVHRMMYGIQRRTYDIWYTVIPGNSVIVSTQINFFLAILLGYGIFLFFRKLKIDVVQELLTSILMLKDPGPQIFFLSLGDEITRITCNFVTASRPLNSKRFFAYLGNFVTLRVL
jgi:hypothetical protein